MLFFAKPPRLLTGFFGFATLECSLDACCIKSSPYVVDCCYLQPVCLERLFEVRIDPFRDAFLKNADHSERNKIVFKRSELDALSACRIIFNDDFANIRETAKGADSREFLRFCPDILVLAVERKCFQKIRTDVGFINEFK